MCMIINRDDSSILVLDKIEKNNIKGLTFIGGHVEDGESIYESMLREIQEESNLKLSDLEYSGMIEWDDKDARLLGFLYKAYIDNSMLSDIIYENREGNLAFYNLAEFKRLKKAIYMDEILSIYEGEYKEIYINEELNIIKKY